VNGKVYLGGGGTYLPGDPIPFEDIDKILGPLTEAPPKLQKWVKNTQKIMSELLDIEYLHYAIDPETRCFTDDNISMSVKAARSALAFAGLSADDIDLICYGSAHQDQMPTATVRIQQELGIDRCGEFSIHANCTSAYKALYLAFELIKSGRYNNALVISSNVSSSELRAEYYNQAILDKESLFLRWFLCDGAGAVVVTGDPSVSKGFEIEHTYIESIGKDREPHMFNNRPALWVSPKQEYEQGLHHLRQRFRNSLSSSVFQEPGGSIFFNGFMRMLAERNIPIDTIKMFQVNLPAKHILDSVKEELQGIGMAESSFYTKLDHLGYSGPPMALICLDKVIREERFEPGDRIASFVTEVSKFMQGGYVVRYNGDG
jgi:3-oxoacyl-[acyl-carrier-protein] synthase III